MIFLKVSKRLSSSELFVSFITRASFFRMALSFLRLSRLLALFFRSMASVIWFPILMTGLRLERGSWKIMEILSPRISW